MRTSILCADYLLKSGHGQLNSSHLYVVVKVRSKLWPVFVTSDGYIIMIFDTAASKCL